MHTDMQTYTTPEFFSNKKEEETHCGAENRKIEKNKESKDALTQVTQKLL